MFDRKSGFNKHHQSAPIYSRVWEYLKHFPQGLATGSTQPPPTSGTAAAALISAGFGCFIMMAIHHLAETSVARDRAISLLGKWIPGDNSSDRFLGDISSYGGRETILPIVWGLSWIVLHQLLKRRQVKTSTIFLWTFGLFVAATAMCWQPLFPYLPLI